MTIKRRDFIRVSAVSAGAATLLSGCAAPAAETSSTSPLDNLKSITGDIVPISLDERKTRIEKAQRLMVENKIEAIYLDGGTTMEYFTGIRWGTSE
ncbi:MAG: twin-arginine translocation signal domain-containing protein, partial [Cyclobacteriaceae bacterium]|nr:twin-arginine translocation signal domain-containing protein [Cyclobacteriaceae bacterium]